MASDEQKHLAETIKNLHESLRQRSKVIGSECAWNEHVQDTKKLQEYASAMEKLATIWEVNSNRSDLLAKSRVKWISEYCKAYFFVDPLYIERRNREERLLQSYKEINHFERFYLQETTDTIRVLDVGSCFNPFRNTPHFDVMAIDLCPASDDVLHGDLLKIRIIDDPNWVFGKNQEITELPCQYFESVIFSLLLEYIPSSQQRLDCCKKAYELLKPEGILIIVTPDSQHVGKNASLMKTWRYALAKIGFVRIRFEKLPHITCMVFRKPINPYLAHRWSETHYEDYMSFKIEIPQDTS